MNKLLTRIEPEKIWHVVDGVKVPGPHKKITGKVSNISGNVSNITGKVTYIRGDVSNITGNVTYIRGDVSLLRGDVTNLSGNIDDCKVTELTKVSDLIID